MFFHPYAKNQGNNTKGDTKSKKPKGDWKGKTDSHHLNRPRRLGEGEHSFEKQGSFLSQFFESYYYKNHCIW